MESAFGINHGEIAKGVPKGLRALAGKKVDVWGGTPKTEYAAQRLKAHTEGKAAGRLVAKPRYRNQGLPQHHALDETRGRGYRARVHSRITAGELAPKPLAAPTRLRTPETRRRAA